MKIVVFGGSGFLGSHVCDKLSEYGHEVTLFDLKKSPWLVNAQKMILGDVLDEKAVEESLLGAQVAYNFAGHSDLDTSASDVRETARQNLMGSLNIIEACLRQKIKQYIYASTIYVYSESGGFYRCSKQASEIYLEEYQRKYGLQYTILRYGTLYGPRADERNSIYRYLRSALEESKIWISSSTGEEMREYIHVRDAAKLSARILSREFYNKRFIITGHQAIPLRRLTQMIGEILRKPLDIRFELDGDSDHYEITPYSFVPRAGEKFAPNIFTDMGQGLIECLAELSESLEDREEKIESLSTGPSVKS